MNRTRLPDRRNAETFEIQHNGQRFAASVGRYDDGSPAEIFVTGPKSGTDLRESLHDASILLSLALQHGCAIETIAAALSRDSSAQIASSIKRSIFAFAVPRRKFEIMTLALKASLIGCEMLKGPRSE